MPMQCSNCGHDGLPLPSLSRIEGDRLMASLEMVIGNQTRDAQRANAELLDTIRELWDENQALKQRVYALESATEIEN